MKVKTWINDRWWWRITKVYINKYYDQKPLWKFYGICIDLGPIRIQVLKSG